MAGEQLEMLMSQFTTIELLKHTIPTLDPIFVVFDLY